MNEPPGYDIAEFGLAGLCIDGALARFA